MKYVNATQTRSHGGTFGGSPLQIVLCPEKFILNISQKRKSCPPKNVLFPPKP